MAARPIIIPLIAVSRRLFSKSSQLVTSPFPMTGILTARAHASMVSQSASPEYP